MPAPAKGIDNPRELTAKQERFIEAYLKTGNATQAYREAGYTIKPNTSQRTIWSNAYDVLHNPRVSHKIDELKLRREQKADKAIVLNKAYVLNALLETVETGLGRKKIKKTVATGEDGSTTEIEVIAPDRTVAVRSAELLGKELAMFVDRREVGGPGDFDRMSMDDLDAWLSEARTEAVGQRVPAQIEHERKPDQE